MVDIVVPLDKLDEAIEDDIEKKVRKVLINVYAHLDSASPLGRPELWQRPAPRSYRPGWFKANWKVIFYRNNNIPVDADKRGTPTPDVRKFKLGRPAAIVNNAPYAERLGEGWSQQAPIGWIEGAVRSGVRSVAG